MAAIFVLAAILDLKKCHPTFLRSLWYPHSESTDNLLLTDIIHESNFNYITAYTSVNRKCSCLHVYISLSLCPCSTESDPEHKSRRELDQCEKDLYFLSH